MTQMINPIIAETNFYPERVTTRRGGDYLAQYDTSIFFVTENESEQADALALEQKIWNENNFGSLEDYGSYNRQSRVISAYKGNECIGVTRLFDGSPLLPPFTDLPFSEETVRDQIISYCQEGIIEELGTTAVDHKRSQVPPGIISTHMWRIAYRDARDRGMKYWGIIMEPERVQAMNDTFNFTFKQLGPSVRYQGGDCAAFLMDLEEVDRQMSASSPELYDWFVKQPLEPIPDN